MAEEGERFDVVLSGGAPWGFRLQGGREFRSPLQIAKLNPGGKAEKAGLKVGDCLQAINEHNCEDCLHNDALKRVKAATSSLTLAILRGAKSKRPSVPGVTSPGGKVAPPWSRTGSSGSASSAASSSSRPASTSGQRPPSTEPSATPSADDGNRRATDDLSPSTSSSGYPTSPLPDATVSARRESAPPTSTARAPAKTMPASSSRSASISASTVTDGSDVPVIPTGPASAQVADLPVEVGQKSKEKGWYKQMFKTIHTASAVPDDTGPSYSSENRRASAGSSSSAASAAKPVPKWNSPRTSSSSGANVAASAKAHEDRRSSSSSSTGSGSGSTFPRRSSRDPPPSVSARTEFFRQKEKERASKDSGLSSAASRPRGGSTSSWSQKKIDSPAAPAPAAKSWKTPTQPPTQAAAATPNQSASLPRASKLNSTSNSSSKPTASPVRVTPEPKHPETFNTLDAALLDLNDAISSLEVATSTAAQKEGKKKTPWQPSSEVKAAPVLGTQSNDHQVKMSTVLEKKITEERVQEVRQPSRQPESKSYAFEKLTPAAAVQTAPKPHPQKPVSPPPPKPTSAPPAKKPAEVVADVPVDTKPTPPPTTVSNTIEPVAVMQMQPPVESFVINLPPPEAEPVQAVAEPQRRAGSRLTEAASEIDALLDAHIQASAQKPQPAAHVDKAPVAKQSEPARAAEAAAPAVAAEPEPVVASEPDPAQLITTADKAVTPPAAREEQDGPAEESEPVLAPGEGYATALYSFQPQSKRELALKKGDKIILTRRIDANWMEGSMDGKKGMFPATYVKVLVAPSQPQRSKSPSVSKLPDAQAQVQTTPSPQAQTQTQTQTQAQVAAVTPSPQSQQTPKAQEHAEQQVVPQVNASAVAAVDAAADTAATVQVREKKPETASNKGLATARYSFQAESIRELSLMKGEQITLIRRVDKNWYEAENTPGLKGIVPSTYLEIIEDVPIMKRASMGVRDEGKKAAPGRPADGPRKSMTSPTTPAQLLLGGSSITSPANTSPAPLQAQQTQSWSPLLSPVESQTQSPPPLADAAQSPGRKFRALYVYTPQNTDELELAENDVIHVVEECTDGWYVGTSERTQQFGTFPGNYVLLLDD